MRVPSAPSTVSVDHAWSDLRRHLEWTRNEPTVVMIAAQTRIQTQHCGAGGRTSPGLNPSRSSF